MLIAERNGFLADGWKNPYVTDGLIAMWDAEGSEIDGGDVIDVVSGLRLQASVSNNKITVTTNNTIQFEDFSAVTLRFVLLGWVSDSAFSPSILFSNCGANNDYSLVVNIDHSGNYQPSLPTPTVVVDYIINNSTGRISPDGVFFNATKQSLWLSWAGSRPKTNELKINISGTSYVQIGNLAIYSRFLTTEEIAANYAIDKARFNLP